MLLADTLSTHAGLPPRFIMSFFMAVNELVCCFRKHWSIDSCSERPCLRGNTAWPLHPQPLLASLFGGSHDCHDVCGNLTICHDSLCVLCVESSQTDTESKDSHPDPWASPPQPPSTPVETCWKTDEHSNSLRILGTIK